jgi:cytochrome bd ubiquinol oxidase subunit I
MVAFLKAGAAVIGQTLAMEGVFWFFLESSFLGLFLFRETLQPNSNPAAP